MRCRHTGKGVALEQVQVECRSSVIVMRDDVEPGSQTAHWTYVGSVAGASDVVQFRTRSEGEVATATVSGILQRFTSSALHALPA
jgi:hypothetical protein